MTVESAQTAPSTPAPETGAPDPAPAGKGNKPPSLRDTVKKATQEVAAREAQGLTETEQARRVLRGEPAGGTTGEAAPAGETEAKPAGDDQPPKPEKKPEKKAAADKSAAKTAEDDAKAKAEKTDTGQPRGPGGKFVAKNAGNAPPEGEQAASGDPDANKAATDSAGSEGSAASRPAPARFSKAAREDWEKAPESVRSEVERFVNETEAGVRKHQEAAQKYSELQPFEAPAASIGLSLKDALADYAGMAQQIRTDPKGVITMLAQRHGFSLEEIAADVMGVELDDYVEKSGAQIKAMSSEIQQLKEQNHKMRAHIEQQVNREREARTADVARFAAENPRFNELYPTIKWILATDGVDKSDPQQALKDAYAMADQIKPAATGAVPPTPAPATPAQETPPDTSAQTARAQKTITGSPSGGSNPSHRSPAKTIRESVKNAAAATGL